MMTHRFESLSLEIFLASMVIAKIQCWVYRSHPGRWLPGKMTLLLQFKQPWSMKTAYVEFLLMVGWSKPLTADANSWSIVTIALDCVDEPVRRRQTDAGRSLRLDSCGIRWVWRTWWRFGCVGGCNNSQMTPPTDRLPLWTAIRSRGCRWTPFAWGRIWVRPGPPAGSPAGSTHGIAVVGVEGQRLLAAFTNRLSQADPAH